MLKKVPMNKNGSIPAIEGTYYEHNRRSNPPLLAVPPVEPILTYEVDSSGIIKEKYILGITYFCDLSKHTAVFNSDGDGSKENPWCNFFFSISEIQCILENTCDTIIRLVCTGKSNYRITGRGLSRFNGYNRFIIEGVVTTAYIGRFDYCVFQNCTVTYPEGTTSLFSCGFFELRSCVLNYCSSVPDTGVDWNNRSFYTSDCILNGCVSRVNDAHGSVCFYGSRNTYNFCEAHVVNDYKAIPFGTESSVDSIANKCSVYVNNNINDKEDCIIRCFVKCSCNNCNVQVTNISKGWTNVITAFHDCPVILNSTATIKSIIEDSTTPSGYYVTSSVYGCYAPNKSEGTVAKNNKFNLISQAECTLCRTVEVSAIGLYSPYNNSKYTDLELTYSVKAQAAHIDNKSFVESEKACGYAYASLCENPCYWIVRTQDGEEILCKK